jgi:energy-coupling factor transporter ATP-binding protein EcfA2
MSTAIEQNIFVEQAEYLDQDSFQAWTTEHPDEEIILRKLSQTGAKLVTGPRGSGKTTLLLKAYYRMLSNRQGGALPIYVNFKSSLKLEPLYKSNANAIYWFNQWLLLKIYQGILTTLSVLRPKVSVSLKFSKQEVDRFTGQLELGHIDLNYADNLGLDISSLEDDIGKILSIVGKTRCVLLLDDAAHAFSPEQQRDFFDFFRQVKSQTISPKAAIYPGVTIYSSTFHVGHDAEEIDIWLKPFSNSYIPFLLALLERRLPIEIFDSLKNDLNLLRLLCYGSFGMPRALLNMVRSFYRDSPSSNTETFQVIFNRAVALKAIKDVFDNTMNVYRSLQVKLPLYTSFITTGEHLYTRALEAVKIYNRGKPVDRQSVIIAIQRPLPAELTKVLGFFQYSGLLMPRGELSRGEKGVFELYAIHYAALIERNALLGKSAVSIAEYVEALEKRHPHEFTRVNPRTLVGTNDFAEAFPLSLPPCQVCHTPRVSEAAKFCLHCGSQLKSISAFESIVSREIKELPLTPRRVQTIRQNSKIRTIKDILIDHDNRELRSVPYVGPYWAKRIYAYAEEYIA